MADAGFRRYRFDSAAQWSATAIAGATIGAAGLSTAARWRWTEIAETGAADATAAIDFDACGRLTWVQPAACELRRAAAAGVTTRGRLAGGEGPRALVADGTRLWLLDAGGLNRYVERTLQVLDEALGDRAILAIAGDRRDGVFVLHGGDGRPASIAHRDGRGRLVQAEIALPAVLDAAAIATSRSGRQIVVLDRHGRVATGGGCCRGGPAWALLVVDACTSAVRILPGRLTGQPFLCPSCLAIDADDQIHLVDGRDGRLLSLSLAGDVLAETRLGVPDAALPVQGLAAGRSLAIAGATGLLIARPEADAGLSTVDVTAMVITPTLISREGQDGGWQRAAIDGLLPEGTTLTVTPATSRDPALAAAIGQIFADQTLSPAAKAAAVDQRLAGAWETGRSVVFASTPGQPSVRLPYALHEIETRYLWLKLVLHAPPGRAAPSLRRLDVLYPQISYLDYLPAVYRSDRRSAAQLRRFLAVFEGLFDDLDALIDRLPQSIDPATAPEEWLPLLLSWLGFPAMPGLTPARARALLHRAGALLAGRGTIGSLEELLGIVTGQSVTVEDAAAGPPPWVLPGDAGASEPPRLGRDTLVLRRDAPAPFALGWSAALGKVPLGRGCEPGVPAFARQSGALTIRIAAPGSESETLQVVTALLRSFLPAHCRYRIVHQRAGPPAQPRRLDRDLRLAGQRDVILGLDFTLGCRRLTAHPADGAIIGRSAGLDGHLSLC